MSCNSPVIVALDFPHSDQALAVADRLDPTLCRVKVGKELFTREGPAILRLLHERSFEVFLDLKFHDIPNTVAKACGVAADMGVWMVNVHASGGREMMSRAREAVEQTGASTLLIAVTVLTSMKKADLVEIGFSSDIQDQVKRLARLTHAAGLDGVVCSAQEAAMLRAALDPEFKLVTPGIRPEGSEANDQKRIMTPVAALNAGVDYMVIGRPITQALDPNQALMDILATLPKSE